MESSIWLVAVLQLAGVAVVIAEVFLPSGGILSLLALGLFGYSIYKVYSEVSVAAGTALAVLDLVTVPILVIIGLKLIAKSPATLSRALSRAEGVVAQDASAEEFQGMTGKALTDLRPAGAALIRGERVDVVSRGEYIRKDAEIIVVEVTGNRIIVRKREEDDSASEGGEP